MRLLPLVVLLSTAACAGEHSALQSRLDEVSSSFLGTPYKLGPLGEGPDGEFDRDPLVRYDLFDCTTYVETVSALALESDKTKAEKLLQKIRYAGGKVGFETRRHFTSADWIPGLIKDGYLEDVTRAVAGEKARVAKKVIKKADWYRAMSTTSLEGFQDASPQELERRAADLRARARNHGEESVEVPYLPLELLPAYLDKIPSGTIANLVREPRPEKPVLITHQIFIFDKNGRKVVRHAAFGRAVEEQDVLAYFEKYAGAKWPLIGLNLNRLK